MKKLLSLALALCMALVLLPGTALAAETSGTCGDGVTWFLGADGTLTISGTGAMKNYSHKSTFRVNVPWDSQRSDITAVVIGDGVTRIGDYAFYYFDNLTSVTIPNSVTAIGNESFAWCGSLTNVTIPSSVTSIGSGVFRFCESLTSVTIPDGVTTIGKELFAVCRSLTSVTIPDSVTSIGLQAFWSCSNLTSVTIPNSVTSIGNEAFSGCHGLTSVTIPDSVTSIGISAFSNCDGLTSVTIPISITSIPQSAFGSDITDVYYGGSESQWKQIPVERGNDRLLAATFHYNSAGPGASATTSAPVTLPTKFTDVAASSPFVDAINWAVEQNITTGLSANIFGPGEECTNGQILTFLWRANGSPEPTINNPFTDSIPASFQKAAVWAYEKGLVSGAAFGSATPCTRAVAVEYLWKATGSPTASGSASFADVPANANYAQAVAWAVANGVTGGTGNGQFSPDNTCTRGQIVTFLYRAMGK